MAEHWFTRTLNGVEAADAECEAALKKYPVGTTFPMDLSTRKTRSGNWHRKYWALMKMLGDHCERVEVDEELWLPIRDKDDAHVAMKYATGLFDSYVTRGGVVRIIKSTAFDSMSPDEWAAYWLKVLDAVHQKFLPNVEIRSIEDEIARLAA